MEVVCERVDAAPEQEPPAPDPPAPEPETPKSRGRPKGAPNKVKEPKAAPPPVPEPVPAPKAKREKREKVEKPRAASPAPSPEPFEPTFEELLGHMGRAMAQQRAVRAQARLDLYSQFLS